MIYIITGGRGAGKTTLVSQLVHCARRQKWRVTGIITLGEWRDGEKVALYAHDIVTGERRLLARRKSATEPWEFVAETLEWGNRVLASAVPTDLLVVDELGPLEWEEARGWTAGLSAIDSGQYRVALVVVRPELVPQAQRRWPQASPGPFAVPPEGGPPSRA
ncbi:MAG: nucleoside-triphosphatase [Candidatus Bipolaricaulia bacterium]